MVPLLVAIAVSFPLQEPGVAAQSTSCIGVIMPSVQGAQGSATAAATAARDLFIAYLSGPSMQVVPLDARLTVHGLEEARQKQCGRVLIVTLTQKRSGGGGGALGRVVGQAGTTAAWHLPGGSAAAAAARTAAAAGSQAASELASGTRAKDEMKLDWKIVSSADGKAAGSGSEKAKAGSDGEDILTPLVQKSSEAIVVIK
jgi:hypothetical protein